MILFCFTQPLFFQCVFAKMETSEAASAANEAARVIFDRHDDAPYMSHLSLIYGNLEDEVKDPIMSEVGRSVIGQEFTVEAIDIWSTNGTAEEWTLVESIPLSGCVINA